MPAQTRNTGIPRATTPSKRTAAPKPPIKRAPTAMKRNAPVPLRGTRPSGTTTRTVTTTTAVAAGDAPRFHLPVMHSPARPPSGQGMRSGGGGQGKGGRTVERTHEAKLETEAEAEAEMEVEDVVAEPEPEPEKRGVGKSDSESASGSAGMVYGESEPEDSPGLGRLGRLLGAEGDAAVVREEHVADVVDNDVHVTGGEGEIIEPPRSLLVESPVQMEPEEDTVPPIARTPRAGTRRVSIARERENMGAAGGWHRPRDPRETPLRRAISLQIPPGPRAVLRELETLLGPAVVAETIDVRGILCAHDACPPPTSPKGVSVFGVALCTTARYASCSTVLGGQTHMLPIVVFAAIEELYRAGLTSRRLFRPARTSRGTSLPALVAAFDTGPTYGDSLDLSGAPLDDVSALLLTYLDALPGPIIARALLPALSLRDAQSVRTAQLLLRLLPAPHFSLLIYLLAFLAQISVYESKNGWSVQAVADAFARPVCGTGEADVAGRSVLLWLLRNWDALSAGLFPKAGTCVERRNGGSVEVGDDLGGKIAALERQHADAVREAYEAGAAAERRMWAAEVQALREAWESEGKVVHRIVKRFAEGAPRKWSLW